MSIDRSYSFYQITTAEKKDMFSYFINLQNTYSIEEIYELFNNDNYLISKLDVNRLYRYLDAYTLIE